MSEEQKKNDIEAFEYEKRCTILLNKHIGGIRACLTDRIYMLVFERRMPSWKNGSEEIFEKSIWDYAAQGKLKHSELNDLLDFLLVEHNNIAEDEWENTIWHIENEEGEEWQKHLKEKSRGKFKKELGESYVPLRRVSEEDVA